MSRPDPNNRTLTSTRLFPFFSEEIFGAFRDPSHLARWWGPAGFSNTFHEFDFKPGGIWRFDMHGPDGFVWPNLIRFEEIVEPSLIVLRHLEPVHGFLMTITLDAEDGQTRMTWRMEFETAEECEKVREFVPRCNEENFDRLSVILNEATPTPHIP